MGGRPHAEAGALLQAGTDAAGATVYVTLEPCAHASHRGPACTDLLIAARPARVVVAAVDPDPRTAGSGLARLQAAGIAAQVLACDEARRSLAGYFTRKLHGRPHVTLKLAVSADGYIAPDGGVRHWLTGPAARAHVHARRARADAILVGGATWRGDTPSLDVRLPGLGARSPRRLVLTRRGTPVGAEAVRTPGDIAALTDTQYLYVEGGAQTAAAFLAGGLVDRLELYHAPLNLGSGVAAPAEIAPASLAAERGGWQLAERRQIGPDLFEAWDRVAAPGEAEG